jgi:hypothetical protein
MFPELNDSCVLDGDIWTSGSTWWKSECEQCSCINGLSFCDEKSPQCPELPESCRVTQVPQGKCCPVCVGEFNPLNAEVNPICHLLALLGAHHILRISRIRVNTGDEMLGFYKYLLCFI